MKNIIIITSFCLLNSAIIAQTYCLQLSKKGKEKIILEEGKRVSYVLSEDNQWEEANIYQIKKDSISFKIEKDSKLFAEGDNFQILKYHIDTLKLLAFPQVSSVAVGSGVIVLLIASAALAGGAPLMGLAEDRGINAPPPKKIFKKEIDFKDGWEVEIIEFKK